MMGRAVSGNVMVQRLSSAQVSAMPRSQLSPGTLAAQESGVAKPDVDLGGDNGDKGCRSTRLDHRGGRFRDRGVATDAFFLAGRLGAGLAAAFGVTTAMVAGAAFGAGAGAGAALDLVFFMMAG